MRHKLTCNCWKRSILWQLRLPINITQVYVLWLHVAKLFTIDCKCIGHSRSVKENKAFRFCIFNSESDNSLHVKKHSRRILLVQGYPFIDPIDKWLDIWDSGKLTMFYCKEIGMEMVSNIAESWYWNNNCLLSGWLVNTSMLQSIPPPPPWKKHSL